MTDSRSELLQGTLEMLVLKTLSLEPMHGWGISLRLRQISGDVFDVNQGSLYPALQRMLRRGWIKASWRASENNRRARYYAISAAGRLNARRTYTEGELELWFALSAFADNASLYDQLIRVSGNVEGSGLAGKSVIGAARRVDAAMQRARPTARIQNAWATIRTQLADLDPAYR